MESTWIKNMDEKGDKIGKGKKEKGRGKKRYEILQKMELSLTTEKLQ